MHSPTIWKWDELKAAPSQRRPLLTNIDSAFMDSPAGVSRSSDLRVEGRGERVSQSLTNGLPLSLLLISDRNAIQTGLKKSNFKGFIRFLSLKSLG